jgi:hypothetical protein
LSVKTTVPVGTPDVDGTTVARNVTDWPGFEGSGVEPIAVVVGATATTRVSAGTVVKDVLGSKFESP